MGDGSICSVDSEGFSKPRRLTNILGVHTKPIYSPNGRQIVFEIRAGDKRCIGLMDRNGNDVAMLTDSKSDLYPSWSPDGKKIVYFSKGKICAMNSDGSGTEELTKKAGNCWEPFYSPDGRKILYRTEADGKKVVCVMNSDGSENRILTADLENSRGARWSPDGERIAFYSKKKGDWHVYTMKSDGTEKPDRLMENAGSTFEPSWCPK